MTDLYAVIGRPIGHSKSPQIHLSFAEGAGQSIRYEKIEGEEGQFTAQVDAFRARGGSGLNITAPFKLDAFAYATDLSDAARLAGAVNCLSFGKHAVRGDNFDGVGLVRDITVNLGAPLTGKRVLMLGAGGAARGALLPILEQKPALLAIVNRTEAHAAALREAAGGAPVASGPYGGLDAEPFDVVLNATSCSLTGVLPPVSRRAFTKDTLAYELAYAKGLTPFLALAVGNGVTRMADGVGMLVEQAAEAFALWRGVRPATARVIEKLRVPLVA